MTSTHCSRNTDVTCSSAGDDQWSNMLAGTELIRRKLGKDAGRYDDHAASEF